MSAILCDFILKSAYKSECITDRQTHFRSLSAHPKFRSIKLRLKQWHHISMKYISLHNVVTVLSFKIKAINFMNGNERLMLNGLPKTHCMWQAQCICIMSFYITFHPSEHIWAICGIYIYIYLYVNHLTIHFIVHAVRLIISPHYNKVFVIRQWFCISLSRIV